MGKEKMKRYSAKFSCGHVGDICYYSNEQLLKMLNNAETKGLCPNCKAENFKKNSVLVTMSYKEYKEFYEGKRGVLCGDYNPDTHKIEVYLTKKKAEEHTKRHERFWCECETLCKDEEGHFLIDIFLCGNSYRVKDKVKQLGYVWDTNNKRWHRPVTVYPELNIVTNSFWVPQIGNDAFYDEINKLESIGCDCSLISIDFSV